MDDFGGYGVMRREVIKKVIKDFQLTKFGYDFMGFTFIRDSELSFHHLFIPRKTCNLVKGLGDGYAEWNCAVLVRNTAHDYLHTIEKYNRRMYEKIQDEMKEEKMKGKLDKKNIHSIELLLREFESDFDDMYTSKGTPIIREEYSKRLFK